MKTTIKILVLLFLTNISDSIFACECEKNRTVQEEIKRSAAVFVGTVLSKQLITFTETIVTKDYTTDTSGMKRHRSKFTFARYDFLLQKNYKGKISSDTITILTGIGGGDCGFMFEVGQKYIVYGQDEFYLGSENKIPTQTNTFWTHRCLRTTAYLQDEIDALDKYVMK